MQNPRLASRYAKSLLELAVEQNKLDSTLADMQLLSAICLQSRDFLNMLRSPIIKADKKQHIIDAVVGQNISPLTKAFMSLLINKGREANLDEIAEAFIGQYKELKNIRTVKLTTAVAVNDSVKAAIIHKLLGSTSQDKIDLETAVDPSLIGGFVVELEDKLIDASIRRDLNEIKAQFTKNLHVSSFN
ncbi:ATP synthase F1 subunit delta [Taibaiella soli]|uniref:ATP synthase subunit delta n=1 Tax=Taibaiella soli TaxID=1649169 RepID=A0A2W2AJU7_9BACT|nr:ATP synthase F1 subunit delta [Taibaiella soli]PZF73812.1 ATP synthase F1 subunit delta [Taibaiella soli]